MALQGGQLLVHRMQVELDSGDTDVDTLVTQARLGVDPPVGGSEEVPSRVMVEMMPPIDNWENVSHGEPYYDTSTKSVHVLFSNSGSPTTINVLVWNPHTLMGPVDADLYATGSTCVGGQPPVSVEQVFGTSSVGEQ